MFNGKQYILYVYKKYRDVRIVYSPPSSIGKYGGDVDNWMWPRHTGDFTFMRVYQAPDGSGATYSTDNVPVHPKNYLHIARRPQKEGDFNFIIGFPGSTTRWRTSYSADWNLNYNYVPSIKEFQEIIDLMDELTKNDPQGKIKVAGMHAGIANVLKNYQGKRDGMLKSHFIQKKQNFENRLMYFINQNPELEKSYGTVLNQIKDLYAKLAKTRQHNELLNSFGYKAGGLASLANQAYGIAREREKPESEREPGFSEKQIKRMVERLKYRFLSYYEPLDKALFKRVLQKAQELPDSQRVKAIDDILKASHQSIDEFVDQAYKNTELKDLEFAQSLFSKSSSELEKLNDPFLNLAVKLYNDMETTKEQRKEFGAKIDHLRSQYLDMLYAWKGKNLYPDANSTMRLTYGYIKGYKPADAVTYSPFTTLHGVIEKNTGKPPFDMPMELARLEARRDFGRWYDRQLNDVPVAFLNTCDITGGNSGSAVMNSKGELVGLAFDGNYEAMTSDWQFDRNIQRTIAVDMRYVMFITQKFAKADYLIKELGF